MTMRQVDRLLPVRVAITIYDTVHSVKGRPLPYPRLNHTQWVSSPWMSNLHLGCGTKVFRSVFEIGLG